MTDITVRFVPGSPFGRAVAATLEEKRLAWRLVPLTPGGQKSPDYLALNPFGRMPLFADDDFTLYETQAILRYIDRLAPEPRLVPREPRAEARMNQALGILDCYLFPRSVPIVFPRVVAPALGLPADDSGVADAVPGTRVCIEALAKLMGERPYIAGAEISLADLALAPHLDFLVLAPEGRAMLAAHANLGAWLVRMKARPSLVSTTWEAMNERAAA